jgi:hypothetical protein
LQRSSSVKEIENKYYTVRTIGKIVEKKAKSILLTHLCVAIKIWEIKIIHTMYTMRFAKSKLRFVKPSPVFWKRTFFFIIALSVQKIAFLCSQDVLASMLVFCTFPGTGNITGSASLVLSIPSVTHCKIDSSPLLRDYKFMSFDWTNLPSASYSFNARFKPKLCLKYCRLKCILIIILTNTNIFWLGHLCVYQI